MYLIKKKTIDENFNVSWLVVEELEDDLALAQRLAELRADGEEYRVEKIDGCFSSILED